MRWTSALILAAFFTQISGEEPLPTPAPGVPDKVTYQEGGRRITLQRVAPPPPVQAARAGAGFQENAPVILPVPPVAEKPHVLLMMSATTYSETLSLVRWAAGSRNYAAFVNVDFRNIAGMGSFETAGATYTLLMSHATSSAEELAVENARRLAEGAAADTLVQLPAAGVFPPGMSTYYLLHEAEAALVDADCQALEELLTYYDAHQPMLAAARRERELEQAAREAGLKANPPAPQDAVIRFWPIKSGTYPTREGSTQP